MDLFFIYLAKSCLIVGLFWGCFMLFLRRETFFNSHRLFLGLGILLAIVFPLVKLKKTILIATPDPSAFALTAMDVSAITTPSFNWWALALWVYGIGVTLLLLRLAIQLLSLRRVIQQGEHRKEGGFTLVHSKAKTAPFSFFNYIVFNPELHTAADLDAIIAHEKIHSKQLHSIDVLWLHAACIFQWMNPLIWSYKKAVIQNLEYIADDGVVSNLSCKKEYQYILVRENIAQNSFAITNPFFNSLIKKRIVMINKTKSNKHYAWKYASILPLLTIFLLTLNTEVVAQTKTSEVETNITITKVTIEINKDTSDEQLKRDAAFVKKQKGIDLKFKGIKRNSKGEITAISSSYKSTSGNSGNYKVSKTEPITAFVFSVALDKNGKGDRIGYYTKNTDEETTDIDASENTYLKGATINIDGSKEKPLYIVDGKEQRADFDVLTLDVNFIESINVFKGESAKKRYGNKGKNGVIEITTKKE